MNTGVEIVLWVIAGVSARTVLPYLQTLKENPETKFDKAFLVPAVASLVISLLAVPFVLPSVPANSEWWTVYCIAFTGSYAVNDLLRTAQKLATVKK